MEDEIDTDQPFYHVTQKEYVEDILSEGLYPGKAVDNLNIYHGREGNRSHIYLWNEKNGRGHAGLILDSDENHVWTADEHTMVEIDMSEDHPLERDYDQLLHVLRYLDEDEDWRSTWVEPFLERFDIAFEGPLSEDNLRDHMDRIPETAWAEKVGSYRTQEPFSPDDLTQVSFGHLASDEQ